MQSQTKRTQANFDPFTFIIVWTIRFDLTFYLFQVLLDWALSVTEHSSFEQGKEDLPPFGDAPTVQTFEDPAQRVVDPAKRWIGEYASLKALTTGTREPFIINLLKTKFRRRESKASILDSSKSSYRETAEQRIASGNLSMATISRNS